MSTIEAIRTGFRITRRFPRIGAIESIWRTAYAILVALFILMGTLLFLRGATVSDLEWQALRSKAPFLISLAIEKLLLQYGDELGHMFLFVVVLSGLMWLLFASLFRPGIVGMLARAFSREDTDAAPVITSTALWTDTRMFSGRIGALNFIYLFFSVLLAILSVGVFWSSVQLGFLAGDIIGPFVTIICITLGTTLTFLLWAIVDLLTDMAQIAVVFEDRHLGDSLLRTAGVIQKKLGLIIGITLILFVLRMILATVFGVVNVVTNAVLGAVWMPLVVPTTVLLWFLQSVFMYYFYIMSLASFACLFEAGKDEVLQSFSGPGTIIDEP
jgi:hypothetical protein